MATTGTSAPPRGYALLGDERLAALAGSGDTDAGAAIHERYADALLRYVRSIVRDPDDAQDVLQQTMLNALQALARRDLEAPLRPWLFRIAHNTSISLLRRRRPTDELGHEDGRAGRSESAETELLARERLRELVDDVAALPERQRAAILLHDVAGLPHEVVAGELGCSGGASRQTVSAARSALRDAVAAATGLAEGRVDEALVELVAVALVDERPGTPADATAAAAAALPAGAAPVLAAGTALAWLLAAAPGERPPGISGVCPIFIACS